MDFVQAQLNRISPVEIELNVEIAWPAVEQELEQSFREVQKNVQLKGFRPGKAPRNLVRQLFADRVQYEVVSTLVQKGLIAALQRHQLTPVSEPELKNTDFKKGEPFTFSVRVEVNPEIEHVKIDGISVVRPVYTLGDDKVDEALARLQESYAEIREPSEARPLTSQDIATVDYKVTVDGTERADLAAKDRELDLGHRSIPAAFSEALVGAAVGDVRNASMTFPADQGALAGKEGQFEITVKQIREKVLPELDDEFAKDVGEESLESLRNAARQQLQQNAQGKSQSKFRNELLTKLSEVNAIPVPPKLIERQAQRLAVEFISSVLGKAPPKNQPMPELEAALKPQAEQKVRAALLFNALATEQRLEITTDELTQHLTRLSEQRGTNLAKLRAELGQGQLDRIRAGLLEEKVFAFLESKVNVEDKPMPWDDAPEEAEVGAQPSSDIHDAGHMHDEGDEHQHGPDCNHPHHNHG